MTAAAARVGIVGCGMVADEYLTTLASCDNVHPHVCADIDPARAAVFGQRHGLSPMDFTTLLDPEVIDLAVILTPPGTHAALTRQAIAARIPAVWVEKPLALTPVDAETLLDAAAQSGTLLGAAPDTTLGPTLLTATRALEHGSIGTPLSATATLFSTGPERWHPTPEPFYTEGAGPLGDMGPYYLAALDQLLGPLHVYAATAHTRKARRIRSGPRAGTPFTAQAPTYIAALLETDDHVPVTLTTSFDAAATRAPHIEIHGTDGTLVLPDPNFHHGDVLHRPYGGRTWKIVNPVDVPAPVSRGMGVTELAISLACGITATGTAERAARIVRLTDTILHTAATPDPMGTSSVLRRKSAT